MTNLLEIKNIKKYFPILGGVFFKKIAEVKAVDGVSFSLKKGETLGLVGESGCGKSTLGKTILQLYKPSAGEIFFEGQKLNNLDKKKLRELRKEMQIIFQDPYESLNSRLSIRQILEEPFIIHKIKNKEEVNKKINELLDIVGLSKNILSRFSHEFSGGQRQRIGIARAISLNPKLVVCDEAVSALDVSIQSQIINLLLDLQKEFNLTYLFIAHDLSVVKHVSDRIAVMYLGKIVELSDSEELYKNPLHPYTKALLSAIPVPDPKHKINKIILQGEIPSPRNPPSGCSFHTRCLYAKDICKVEEPQLGIFNDKNNNRWVSCHFAEKINTTSI